MDLTRATGAGKSSKEGRASQDKGKGNAFVNLRAIKAGKSAKEVEDLCFGSAGALGRGPPRQASPPRKLRTPFTYAAFKHSIGAFFSVRSRRSRRTGESPRTGCGICARRHHLCWVAKSEASRKTGSMRSAIRGQENWTAS